MALNEAAWLDLRVEADERTVGVAIAALTLPEAGPESSDRVRWLRLTGVSRVAASLRPAWWSEPVEATHLDLDDLPETVRSFEQLPIYGWEFFDREEAGWAHWHERLSLDVRFTEMSSAHTLDLFQSAPERTLDLRVWFDELSIQDGSGADIPLPAFIAGGVRWWDALYAGDSRISGTPRDSPVAPRTCTATQTLAVSAKAERLGEPMCRSVRSAAMLGTWLPEAPSSVHSSWAAQWTAKSSKPRPGRSS